MVIYDYSPHSEPTQSWRILGSKVGLIPMKYLLLLVFLYLHVFFLTQHAFSHSGGLASDGCHFNHKLGTRHCHRGKNGEKTNEVNISGAKVYVFDSDLTGDMTFREISASKKKLWKIYEQKPETFYCGCDISEKQPVHSSCGYSDQSSLSLMELNGNTSFLFQHLLFKLVLIFRW